MLDLKIGRVFPVPKKGEESSSCLTLLDRLFRAYVGFNSPQGFLAAGIISESAYSNLVKRIDQELEENEQKARETETERKMERAQKAREKALDDMKARHANYVKALQDKAFERISTIEVKELSPGDALRWIEASIRLERLSHKLPNKYDHG